MMRTFSATFHTCHRTRLRYFARFWNHHRSYVHWSKKDLASHISVCFRWFLGFKFNNFPSYCIYPAARNNILQCWRNTYIPMFWQ